MARGPHVGFSDTETRTAASLGAGSVFMVFISRGETLSFAQSAVIVFILTAVSGIVGYGL